MNKNAGTSVFGDTIDEVLTEKIIRHSRNTVSEPSTQQATNNEPLPRPETRNQHNGKKRNPAKIVALAFVLILLFVFYMRAKSRSGKRRVKKPIFHW